MDALLFKLSPLNCAPEWKVCSDDWIGFYKSRGWFLLVREAEVVAEAEAERMRDIAETREADETKWNRLFKRRGD